MRPEPLWENNVCYCHDRCRWYDGKRCEIQGSTPNSVHCEPEIRLTKTAADGYRAAVEIACASSLLDFEGKR